MAASSTLAKFKEAAHFLLILSIPFVAMDGMLLGMDGIQKLRFKHAARREGYTDITETGGSEVPIKTEKTWLLHFDDVTTRQCSEYAARNPEGKRVKISFCKNSDEDYKMTVTPAQAVSPGAPLLSTLRR